MPSQGAAVVLSGTRREALEALATELGERAFVCPADLRDSGAADALVLAAEAAGMGRTLGRFQILGRVKMVSSFPT